MADEIAHHNQQKKPFLSEGRGGRRRGGREVRREEGRRGGRKGEEGAYSLVVLRGTHVPLTPQLLVSRASLHPQSLSQCRSESDS